jgi:hypothetical protein
VDADGERSCKKVWKLALFVSARSCLSSRVAAFSNRLFSGVRNRCQFLRSLLLFDQNRAIIGLAGFSVLWGCGPSSALNYVVEVLDCRFNVGVGFKGAFNNSFSLIRWRKASQCVFLLQSLGQGTRRIAWVESVTRTGERSEESSRQDFASVKLQVTQKSTRSGSLFRPLGQYVGLQEDRCLKLLLSNVLSNTRPRGVVSRDPQLVCLAL